MITEQTATQALEMFLRKIVREEIAKTASVPILLTREQIIASKEFPSLTSPYMIRKLVERTGLKTYGGKPLFYNKQELINALQDED
jgi:hypothetical protein